MRCTRNTLTMNPIHASQRLDVSHNTFMHVLAWPYVVFYLTTVAPLYVKCGGPINPHVLHQLSHQSSRYIYRKVTSKPVKKGLDFAKSPQLFLQRQFFFFFFFFFFDFFFSSILPPHSHNYYAILSCNKSVCRRKK